MIITNGVVRTMDPSLPTAAALAIAGDRIVGGVGTHETALPTPDRVDLRGRCVLPAFSDAHVHFPTWSLARRDIQLEGAESLAEALDRVAAHAQHGEWIRGRGWRDALWHEHPTREALDSVTGETPAALWSKDYHSLWLNSAALARAEGDLEVPGGVVERDAAGEPTGILREESAWQFRERHVIVSEDEYVAATRDGIKIANARGIAAVHDKDGWLGAQSVFARIHERDGLTLRVWQSLPHERIAELAELQLRPGLGDDYLRIGYLKAFMDGTLGSQTAWMLDGSGVRITSGEELAEIVRRAAAAGWPLAVHAIGDRANREALDAFASTREVWQPLGLRPAHRACAVRRSGRPAALRSRSASHARCSSATHRPIVTLPRGSGAGGSTARTRSGRSSTAAPSSRTARTLRSRSSTRSRGSPPACAGRSTSGPRGDATRRSTVEQALHASTVAPAWLAGDERRRGKLLPGFLADLVVLDRDPVACPAEELPELEVVATMVGGRWVHNPPPWD